MVYPSGVKGALINDGRATQVVYLSSHSSAPFSHGAMDRCSSMRLDWMRWIRLKKSSSGTVGAGTCIGNVLRWSSIRAPWMIEGKRWAKDGSD